MTLEEEKMALLAELEGQTAFYVDKIKRLKELLDAEMELLVSKKSEIQGKITRLNSQIEGLKPFFDLVGRRSSLK
ncbi:MAG: hypothetical protein C4555_04375 [Dehalococcoidia bacterium]|nr:MAG: hypothetical protein C4555_04375 [Dehalococcoidia bacterium]